MPLQLASFAEWQNVAAEVLDVYEPPFVDFLAVFDFLKT